MPLGVPVVPLFISLGVVFFIAMETMAFFVSWYKFLILILPLIDVLVLKLIVHDDDKALRQWWLYFQTTARNRHKSFWKASSYAPARASNVGAARPRRRKLS